jgi:hypothetical protein
MAFSTSEEKIVAAEAALGRTLPEPLRTRIAQCNGGEVSTDADDWQLNPVRDATDRKRLARTNSDIVLETDAARDWPGFPKYGIAVASNGTGDLLILLPDSDKVWLWNHETGEVQIAAVQWS